MEWLHDVTQFLEKAQALVAAVVLAIPLIIQTISKVKELKEQARAKREQGLIELIPWVVRKGHEMFAGYKALWGSSHTDKKAALKDLIVAAHRRQNGEASISEAEIEMVLAKAESYWKDNKSVLQNELTAAAGLKALAGPEPSPQPTPLIGEPAKDGPGKA